MHPLTPQRSPRRSASKSHLAAVADEPRSIRELVQGVVQRSRSANSSSSSVSASRSPPASPRLVSARAEIARLRAEVERLRGELAAAVGAAAARARSPSRSRSPSPRAAAAAPARRRRRSPAKKGPAPIPGDINALEYNQRCAYKIALFFEKEWPTLGPQLMKLGKKAMAAFDKKYAQRLKVLLAHQQAPDFDYQYGAVMAAASKELMKLAGEEIGNILEQHWTEDAGLCFRPARMNDVIFEQMRVGLHMYFALGKSTKGKFNRAIVDEAFFGEQ